MSQSPGTGRSRLNGVWKLIQSSGCDRLAFDLVAVGNGLDRIGGKARLDGILGRASGGNSYSMSWTPHTIPLTRDSKDSILTYGSG
jgi:hypothetical protein